jgi:hypothetical protein
VNGQAVTSYHAERRVADQILVNLTRQCTISNGKVNYCKLYRKLRRYTIFVYRNDGNSTPCQECSDYLYANGFRTIICTHEGNMVKYNLADYRSKHLSNAQKKFHMGR